MPKTPQLDSSLISDPRRYNMALRISDTRLDILLRQSVPDENLIYSAVTLDTSTTESLSRALEEAVYDNPALLGDFAGISVIIESARYTVVPDVIGSFGDDFMDTASDILLPADDVPTELLTTPIAETGAMSLMRVPSELTAFLRRTFNNPAIIHHMAPLAAYCLNAEKLAGARRMYANLRTDSLDIIAFDGTRLLMATTFGFRDTMDAVYYIMATRELLGLTAASNELLLAGNPELRGAVTPILRRYVPYVMPAIYPADIMRAGKDMMRAPLDLIALQLCE